MRGTSKAKKECPDTGIENQKEECTSAKCHGKFHFQLSHFWGHVKTTILKYQNYGKKEDFSRVGTVLVDQKQTCVKVSKEIRLNIRI